eukprot:CAMPEP_0184388498 /NCGR_PEP_ID=MMETSP0007-20130409/11678_1 /TAXON_ID=97485 /ORGANISM="Prymnesium parvum, Strain Texoma1" /LENGTH=81 /DNA_ID=CAMNT_0026737399 /DNA_START=194 /DNA_END=438 /DNA_ORIENTATION=-
MTSYNYYMSDAVLPRPPQPTSPHDAATLGAQRRGERVTANLAAAVLEDGQKGMPGGDYVQRDASTGVSLARRRQTTVGSEG